MNEQPPVYEEDATEQEETPSRTFKILFAAAMIVIAIGYAWLWRVKTERVVVEAAPAIAIASIASYITGDSIDDAAVTELVAASVARVEGVEVVSLRQLRQLPDTAPGDPRVQRRPRSRQVLDGALHRSGELYRLELRRMNAGMDSLFYEFAVTGATPAEAAHRAAVQVAMSLGLPLPEPRQ